MEREYYLSKITMYVPSIGKTTEVNQLVKCSTKKNAKDIVRHMAIKEGHLEENIYDIVVFDTLIGD